MWKPVDTEFYAPRLPVSIAAVSSDGVEFVRSTLEALHYVVLLHAIGTPTDFLKVIAQGAHAPRYMLIMGHGTEEGLYFGDYGPAEIDTSMLRNRSMPPEVIQQHVYLPGCTVISAFCAGGKAAMAQAFLKGDVAASIGCRTSPDAVALNVFLVNLLFGIQAKHLSDRDAWQRAVIATDHEDIDQMSYFRGDGTEERL
jgi:hypothetical protein